MSDPKQSNKAIRSFILVIGVGLIIWSLYQEKKPQDVNSTLEFRMVTGIQNGNFQVIMMETNDRFFVLDSAFRETFEMNDAEVVTRPEQVKLLSVYQDLQYRAGLALDKNSTKKQVRVSREMFNQLSFDQPFSAQISKKVPDSLISITPL